jgi:glycosyltransferase involved in cell wall biosynthesis
MSCPVKIFDYAMAGCAIVGDNTTEITQKLSSQNAAIVSDPNNTQEFVCNAKQLLSDDKMYERMSTNAREIVKDKFSREHQGQQAVNYYTQHFEHVEDQV